MNFSSVYIVLLNWNGLEDTLECLSSLKNLTYPAVKTIVVDNASKKNEAEIIESKFPDAVILKQNENMGFCGGCNVGIKYALENNAEYVMLLNNDTLVPPNLLERLFEGLAKLDNAGAVSPVILEYPETDKIWFSKAHWESSIAKFRLADKNETYEDLTNKSAFISDFACGCCLFASAEIYRQQGLLDERYFAFYDEAEWCARIRRSGFESYVIPSAFIFHKVSRSTPSLVSTYLLARNRLLWMQENLLWSETLKSFPYLIKEVLWHLLHLIGLTNKSIYTKSYSRAMLQGYKHFILRKFFKWDKKTEKILFNTYE